MLRLYKQSLTKLAGKRSYNCQANSVLSRTTCLKTNFLNRDLSGPFKDRQQGLENKTVREHEERIIRELREELKVRLPSNFFRVPNSPSNTRKEKKT